MLQLEQAFGGVVFRSFVDLGPPVDGAPLSAWGVEFACRSLIEGRDYPWMYAEYPASFRDRLLEVNGLDRYRVQDPRDLAEELRTARWEVLCDALDTFEGLPLVTQWRTLRLLGKLGFHQCVMERVPEVAAADLSQSELAADIAYCRALAEFATALDAGAQVHMSAFELLAEHAPAGTLVRIHALNQLAVHSAKRRNDVNAVEHWLTRHRAEIERAAKVLGPATYMQQLSRHHRAAGFLPQMKGDRAGVVREMDQCQAYAERLPRQTLNQRVVADELMHAALESRTKEAMWLGDFALAEARARRLVRLNRLDPLPWCQLGLVLIEENRIEDALDAYLAATRIPTAEAAEAWFMAGQCYEGLALPHRACDAYLQSLRCDSLGIAAVERLIQVAPVVHPALTEWARDRLAQTQTVEAAQGQSAQPLAYQRYPSQAGMTLGAVPSQP